MLLTWQTSSISPVTTRGRRILRRSSRIFFRVSSRTYREAGRRVILPILRQFEPDAILVSLGVDAHYMDPLASLTLSSTGYLDLVKEISNVAAEICQDRYALFLEGGYNIYALAEVVGGATAQAIGLEPDIRFKDVHGNNTQGAPDVEAALHVQSRYWDL